MDYHKISQELIEFRNARQWGRHHTGPELARALSIEVSELNELFLWGEQPEYSSLEEEVADCFIYLIYLCKKYKINPELAILKKIEMNAQKYPI